MQGGLEVALEQAQVTIERNRVRERLVQKRIHACLVLGATCRRRCSRAPKVEAVRIERESVIVRVDHDGAVGPRHSTSSTRLTLTRRRHRSHRVARDRRLRGATLAAVRLGLVRVYGRRRALQFEAVGGGGARLFAAFFATTTAITATAAIRVEARREVSIVFVAKWRRLVPVVAAADEHGAGGRLQTAAVAVVAVGHRRRRRGRLASFAL